MSEHNSLNDQITGTDDLIKDSNTSTFMNDVIRASMNVPVIVDFWAPGSTQCAELTSLLEAEVTAAKGAVKLVKINLQENPEIANQFQVQAVPTVYALKNGQPVDGFQGPMPGPELKKFIQKLTGANEQFGELLEEAATHLSKGEAQAAVDIYANILREDPQNPDALGGLIKCYIEVGELTAAKETLEMLEDDLLKHEAIQSAKSALDLAEKADDTGDIAELQAAVTANPSDHEKRLELAIAAAAANKRQIAIDELLTILRTNLQWQDGIARKQLLEFFEAWGPKDPHTIEGRKQLTSLLF